MVDFGRDCLWVPQLGIDRRSVGTLTLTLTKLALGPRARFCLEVLLTTRRTRENTRALHESALSVKYVCVALRVSVYFMCVPF